MLPPLTILNCFKNQCNVRYTLNKKEVSLHMLMVSDTFAGFSFHIFHTQARLQ